MTRLERKTRKAIINFCIAHLNMEPKKVHYIYPRIYVLGRGAPSWLCYAVPYPDLPIHVRNYKAMKGVDTSSQTNHFDDSLKAGDFASGAYVEFKDGSFFNVIIKCVWK